jgi:hypothetical protein
MALAGNQYLVCMAAVLVAQIIQLQNRQMVEMVL